MARDPAHSINCECPLCCPSIKQTMSALKDKMRIASPQATEFKWPPLPEFPRAYAKPGDVSLFSEHQMQGYANAYGEAVRAAMAASPAEPAQSGEPVAWRHKWTNDASNAWQYEIAGPQTDKLRIVVPGILNPDSARSNWEALYAAPQASKLE